MRYSWNVWCSAFSVPAGYQLSQVDAVRSERDEAGVLLADHFTKISFGRFVDGVFLDVGPEHLYGPLVLRRTHLNPGHGLAALRREGGDLGLRRAKRRAETGEWIRTIHREFAASTYASYLSGLEPPFELDDISAVQDLFSQYENLPADSPQRLPGRVVSLCAYARLLLAAGDRSGARSCLDQIVPSWLRWCRQREGNQCAALAIGMEILEVSELLGSRMMTFAFRHYLKLS